MSQREVFKEVFGWPPPGKRDSRRVARHVSIAAGVPVLYAFVWGNPGLPMAVWVPVIASSVVGSVINLFFPVFESGRNSNRR